MRTSTLHFILSVSSFALSTIVLAQSADSQGDEVTYIFDESEQTLDSAIKKIEMATGWKVRLDARVKRSEKSSPIKGKMTVQEAVQMLFDAGIYQIKPLAAKALSVELRADSQEIGGRQRLLGPNSEHMEVKGERKNGNDYRSYSSSVATKTDTPLIEIPQSVSILERSFIDDQNISNVSQAHQYAVGVIRSGDDGPATSRGFSLGWLKWPHLSGQSV